MTKFPIKTVAACAVTALAVGATSATAGSLITGAKIKDGSIHMKDLSPGVKAKLHTATASAAKGKKVGPAGPAGANGTNGTNGVDGVNGSNGTNGSNGADGVNGAKGADGAKGDQGLPGLDGLPGKPGKDADQYDRIVGTCATDDPYAAVGEVSVHDGVAQLGVPNGMAWAQVKTFPKNLLVSDIKKLSFSTKATDAGQTYMKIATTNHGSIVFDANSQPGGETVDQMVTNDVRNGTVRWNDDAGFSGQKTWQQMLTIGGNKHVKSISITAGCALGDAGQTLVDQLTVNEDVISFS